MSPDDSGAPLSRRAFLVQALLGAGAVLLICARFWRRTTADLLTRLPATVHVGPVTLRVRPFERETLFEDHDLAG